MLLLQTHLHGRPLDLTQQQQQQAQKVILQQAQETTAALLAIAKQQEQASQHNPSSQHSSLSVPLGSTQDPFSNLGTHERMGPNQGSNGLNLGTHERMGPNQRSNGLNLGTHERMGPNLGTHERMEPNLGTHESVPMPLRNTQRNGSLDSVGLPMGTPQVLWVMLLFIVRQSQCFVLYYYLY